MTTITTREGDLKITVGRFLFFEKGSTQCVFNAFIEFPDRGSILLMGIRMIKGKLYPPAIRVRAGKYVKQFFIGLRVLAGIVAAVNKEPLVEQYLPAVLPLSSNAAAALSVEVDEIFEFHLKEEANPVIGAKKASEGELTDDLMAEFE
jgi:hypothetical protein